MIDTISPHGFAFVADFEGGRSADGLYRAYFDQFGGVWTIGIGQTKNVHQGMVWTEKQARDDFQSSLKRDYIPAVLTLGPMNQNQFDAWCSIVWNLGIGAVNWDIGRFMRAGNIKAVAQALLQYDHAGGVRLAGLTRRRHAEADLLLTPWVDPDPHHYGLFSTVDRQMGGGREANEQETVIEYDKKRKHPKRYWIRLRRLRDNLGVLAAGVENRARSEGDPELKLYHRKFRHDNLVGRANGRRYVA
jgi:lysozyme